MEGQHHINELKYKWRTFFIFQGFALAVGGSLFLGSLLHHFFNFTLWAYPTAFVTIFAIFLFAKPFWKIDSKYVIRYLDSNFPQLEESSALLIKPASTLGVLEQLQAKKISKFLSQSRRIIGASKKIFIALAVLAFGLITMFTVKYIPIKNNINTENSKRNLSTETPVKENILPQVENYNVVIIPPSYTSNAVRSQKQFYIKAELGAKATWNIETNKPIKSFYVTFNDKEKIKLSPSKDGMKKFVFSRNIEKQGYYQLEMDGTKSDLYQIEVVLDLPVYIKITQPKPQTTIDIGAPAKIELNAILTDDYGISDAFISATMASGKGESVSFTEKKINFNSTFNNQKISKLSKRIDLKSLGMKPGDELYFYIQARDNKGQQSRSDVYFVSIVDTTELMSMAGMASGVNLVPEYFRSERQIIIDTEKLLAEKCKLSTPEFNKRSNELGVDQKLLRMRYGQFLGEENEVAIGEDGDEHDEHDGHDHEGHDHNEPAGEKFGDVQSIMDKYAHKHDTAEDPTFFEPEVKAQLKAVLSEMWKAELKLRTYRPQEALPFEYKALRLLKDLQQKSRAYVAKTTIKTTTLKQEKRLTGELGKIGEPRQTATFEIRDHAREDAKILLSLLSNHRTGKAFSANEKAFLQIGEKQIIAAAVKQPSAYLKALKSLRTLNSEALPSLRDVALVSSAIYQIIGAETIKPQAKTSGVSSKLSNSYFNNLKKY